MRYGLLLILILCFSCNQKKERMETLEIPVTDITIENLSDYLDTTTRTFFIQYTEDSSVAILTDSAAKTQIHIPLKLKQ